ncbi:MAG: cytochrome C [Thermodesulfobacteriota bacterium]|jgi:hypothetical protein
MTRSTRIAAAVCAACLIALTAHAGLKVIGEGADRRFDPAQFPPEYQASYKLMEARCNVADCHDFQRTVDAIATGVATVTNTPFDKAAAKAYGVKMMRMPNSGIDKAEAKQLVELMYYMIDQR